ncbi:hypothetical protein [Spirosoma jeollabukense]
MEFFTINEIKHFTQIAGQTYRFNKKEDTQDRDLIKQGVWSKTKNWADLLRKQLGNKYKVDFKMIWSQRGWENGTRVSKFKTYTWARVYKSVDANKDIYYTIGVDGPSERLIIKLDYQRHGRSTLSEQQAQRCHQLLRPDVECYWVSISLTDIQQEVTSWEILIDKTASVLRKYESVYNNVLEQLWPNEVRLARVAYNTLNWMCLSGSYGKSTDLTTHEAKYGYGYEEWLLDFGKRLDGYHYGFLEPVRTPQNAHQGKTFDVWLYTINAATKERFWIGFIRNVQVLMPDQIQHAWSQYEVNGWLGEMRQQISLIDSDQYDFSGHIGEAIFNIRFNPDEATIYPEPVKVDADSPVMTYHRYVFINAQGVSLPEVAQEEQFEFKAGELVTANGIAPSTYDRQAKTIQLAKQHQELSHKLYRHLVYVYGSENIGTENRTLYNSSIDIVRRDGEDLCFYEIKTYSSLKKCIREAIGQLMEYSYWTTGQLAKELIIVTTSPADAETRSYMKNLRQTLNLPIWYQQFDLSQNALSIKV